jgi:hypothetical protein
MEQLKNDPLTADIIGRPGTMTLVIAQDRRLVYYPCVNNTIMNCLFIHPSSESRAEGQGESYRGLDRPRCVSFSDSHQTGIRKETRSF